MKKLYSIVVIFIMLFSSSTLLVQSKTTDLPTVNSEKPIEIISTGHLKRTIAPFLIIDLFGFPDQMYYIKIGYINIGEGNTTIHNIETNETNYAQGHHFLFFYDFYGPTYEIDLSDASITLEGHATYAMILGGEKQ